MIGSQKQKLQSYTASRISIGVTHDGQPKQSIAVPWELTANAFNMRTPDVYLSPEDLSDEAVWTALGRFSIVGCYIFCPLTDYGFLRRLMDLEDLHIRKGLFFPDLKLLAPMDGLFQLYLEDALIPSLSPIFPRKGLHSVCLCLSGCMVDDISALEQPDVRLSELVILEPEGTNQRRRWRNVRCSRFSYYEYRAT